MKKQATAILIAFLMTACVGISILGIGSVALFNKQGITPSNSQKVQASNVGLSQSPDVKQLQDLVAQYQAREKQYQDREKQYQQQLAQAQAQIQADQQQMQQVQLLLGALQQRGVITVSSDGQIFINR